MISWPHTLHLKDGYADELQLIHSLQDGDGLNDGDEYLHGTSPVLKDTDGDRLSDAVEVEKGSDPLDPESKPRADLSGLLLLLLQ